MTMCLLVTEGKDDLNALRGLLHLFFTWVKTPGPPMFADRDQTFGCSWPDTQLHVLSAGGKNNLAKRARENLALSAPDQFDRVGICFDPDDKPADPAVDALAQECLPEGWSRQPCDGGYQLGSQGREVKLVMLPWSLGASFDRLDEGKRLLERAAVEVLNRTSPQEGILVDRLLKVIQDDKRRTTWKTAFRLWAALRYPDVDPDWGGAMDQVFYQDHAVRAALQVMWWESDFLKRLELLTGQKAQAIH